VWSEDECPPRCLFYQLVRALEGIDRTVTVKELVKFPFQLFDR
jgi:hypothetical protein